MFSKTSYKSVLVIFVHQLQYNHFNKQILQTLSVPDTSLYRMTVAVRAANMVRIIGLFPELHSAPLSLAEGAVDPNLS